MPIESKSTIRVPWNLISSTISNKNLPLIPTYPCLSLAERVESAVHAWLQKTSSAYEVTRPTPRRPRKHLVIPPSAACGCESWLWIQGVFVRRFHGWSQLAWNSMKIHHWWSSDIDFPTMLNSWRVVEHLATVASASCCRARDLTFCVVVSQISQLRSSRLWRRGRGRSVAGPSTPSSRNLSNSPLGICHNLSHFSGWLSIWSTLKWDTLSHFVTLCHTLSHFVTLYIHIRCSWWFSIANCDRSYRENLRHELPASAASAACSCSAGPPSSSLETADLAGSH